MTIYFIGGFAIIIALLLLLRPLWIRQYKQLLSKRLLTKTLQALDAGFPFSNSKDALDLLSKWKKSAGIFLHKPIQSYTTNEIQQLTNDSELTTTLKRFDKYTFGGINDLTQGDIDTLKDQLIAFANHQLQEKNENR